MSDCINKPDADTNLLKAAGGLVGFWDSVVGTAAATRVGSICNGKVNKQNSTPALNICEVRLRPARSVLYSHHTLARRCQQKHPEKKRYRMHGAGFELRTCTSSNTSAIMEVLGLSSSNPSSCSGACV